LSSNVVGANNTALGFGALQNNTASLNTAVGRVALFANTSGTNNVAFGNATMYATTTGSLNTGFGTQALRLNTTGSSNVALGYQSLYTNISGSFNTAVGDGALYNNTGTGNIGIGDDGGYNLTTGSNNIYIGNPGGVPGGGTATESGNIRIGYTKNGAVGLHTDTYLAGVVHGNGAALTNVPATALTGTIASAQIAAGAVTLGKVATGAISIGNLQSLNGPAAGQVLSSDGTNFTWTNPAGVWSLNGSSAYYLGGNVGIGTSTPTASLELSSASGNPALLRLRSPNGNGLIEAIATRPTIQLRDQNSSISNPPYTVIGGWDGGLRVYGDNFWQGGNALAMMAMDSFGHLGIGTGTPLSALHVSGAADALRLTGPTPYLTLDNTTAGFISRIQANGAGMDLKTNGASINNHPGIIHLDGVGTVGLGTTTPRHHLSIRYFAGGPTWTSNGWIGAIDMDNAAAIGWATNSAGQRFGMGHTNGSFAMWRTASDPGTTGSPATYDFVITDAGNVGIGTTGPAAKLQVISSGDIGTPQALLTQTTSGDYARLRFTATGSPSAWDVAAGSTGGVMNFYATSTAKNVLSLNPNGTVSVQVLTITGGADLAEPFPMKEEALEKGSVVVIDEDHPGRLKRSRSAYDTRVAGIVSGANGVNPGIALHQEGILEGGQNVALTGRVYVQADASGGPIRPGDMLTTSDLPGHAMKVIDHARAQGAILGKAMSSLEAGEGMVLVLVTLQ
jgi:hypothetical protein